MNELTQYSASELVAKMHARELSAVEVFNAHAEAIEASNSAINALVTLCLERGLDEARLADTCALQDNSTGVLHGLPYAVKDTLRTKDLRTTYGSLVYEQFVPTDDELHVERARRAGAIVIGKSNTPEFAFGIQTDNPVFGLTRNPFDQNKTVTGSSGGAAAALAANMVPMADGSDLGGSLRTPASVCGIVGFRPTAGQVPKRAAALPFDGLHVFGPMARYVEDIALFMWVFAGHDDNCPLSATATPIDFSATLKSDFSATRIALSATPCGTNTDPQVQQIVNSHQSSFESIGCIVEQDCPEIAENHRAHYVTAAINAVSELSQHLGDKRFGQNARIRQFLEQGQSLTSTEIIEARRTQAQCWQVMSKFFSRFDFLVWPTMAGLPYDADLPEEEVFEDWRPVELTPSLNLPAISLPAGFSHEGLPIGLQIIGPPNSDFKILQLAFAFQQAVQLGYPGLT